MSELRIKASEILLSDRIDGIEVATEPWEQIVYPTVLPFQRLSFRRWIGRDGNVHMRLSGELATVERPEPQVTFQVTCTPDERRALAKGRDWDPTTFDAADAKVRAVAALEAQ